MIPEIEQEIDPMSDVSAELSVERKTEIILAAAADLKAENPLVLGMTKVTAFADVFILLSGRSDRHVRSVADSIIHALREAGEEPLGVEGLGEGNWVLIDSNDLVVHIFDPETREHFDLERLWSDAPRLAGSAEIKDSSEVA
jgi:ribosome-associated protein